MAVREVKPRVEWVGSIDWDRRLFDELIPLPDGTSYNCYLIRGSDKTALIDTVDPTKTHELVGNLAKSGVGDIDYVVANHAEKDHSGSIPAVLDMFPRAQVVTNEKCKTMLMDLMPIDEDRFKVVGDGEALALGGKTLEFISAPWVHWPETMLTYLREDKVLFPCDFLGSHLATTELFVNVEIYPDTHEYRAAKRYYAEIMMPFRAHIKKHLEKLAGYEIDMVAPSHGPLHNKPGQILDAYRDWVSDDVKNEVVIPYVSMWGATEKMVTYFVDALIDRGVAAKPFRLTRTDIGELAMALVDAATVVVASPTVLGGAHPVVAYAAILANALKPKARYATVIGSYSWGGKMVDQLVGLLPNLKVELLDPVMTKGYPKDEDFNALDLLADAIAEKHRAPAVRASGG